MYIFILLSKTKHTIYVYIDMYSLIQHVSVFSKKIAFCKC